VRSLSTSDGTTSLTPDGDTFAARAVAARLELLAEALDDPSADRDTAVNDLLHRLAR
jgi:hypothetical protein